MVAGRGSLAARAARYADRPSVMVIRSAVLGGPGGTAAICATSPRSEASDTARASSQLVPLVVLRMNLPASVPDTQMVQSHSFQERLRSSNSKVKCGLPLGLQRRSRRPNRPHPYTLGSPRRLILGARQREGNVASLELWPVAFDLSDDGGLESRARTPAGAANGVRLALRRPGQRRRRLVSPDSSSPRSGLLSRVAQIRALYESRVIRAESPNTTRLRDSPDQFPSAARNRTVIHCACYTGTVARRTVAPATTGSNGASERFRKVGRVPASRPFVYGVSPSSSV